MNHFKKAAFSLLLVIPIAYSSAASAGSIVLGKENGDICVLPLPPANGVSVRYNLRRTSSPCDHFNDNVRTITFRDVPSATVVTLSDHEGLPENASTKGVCGSNINDAFRVRLKTIKKQTTTDNIELDHLPAYSSGAIIVPGLQMVSIRAASHLRDKLSCVEIRLSPTTPSTPTP